MAFFYGVNKEVLPLKVITIPYSLIYLWLSSTILILNSHSFHLCCIHCQANLIVQEARHKVAMGDLNKAQAQLDEKQKELDQVQAMYDAAVGEKQVLDFS